MSIWKKIMSKMTHNDDTRGITRELLTEYREKGYIKKTCREMLELSDSVIARFYSELSESGDTESPVKHKKDSGWMAESDFCFINPKAAGIGNNLGNFIQAAKILPVIRVNAIHLVPFLDYERQTSYAPRSGRMISLKMVHLELARHGITAESQLKAFVDACHILKKTVGYDVEPHTAQYSRIVIEKPEYFRWYKLNDKKELDYGLCSNAMLLEENQVKITEDIKKLVSLKLSAAKIKSLEPLPDDTDGTIVKKEMVYSDLVQELIKQGFWPIPCHTWAGVGIPDYDGYNFEHNFAKFKYLTASGKDQGDCAYHMLTPIKFYSGLEVNTISDKSLIHNFQDGIDYFAQLFNHWRDDYNFDFLRYDSVDHIFDSTINNSLDLPASDRPTPSVLASVVNASKSSGKPYIGNLAERMGNEIKEYSSAGFDLILGSDMMERIDRNLLEKSFRIHQDLIELNQNRSTPFSIPFCIDTHDTGNPHIWGEPLVKKMGFERMRLRHFISRFISCGPARRPKYEVMGTQDLSYGLYQSNIRDINLEWIGNKDFNQLYHHLEDIYSGHQDFLKDGILQNYYITDQYAWWIIKNNGLMIALVSLETAEGRNCGNITIDLKNNHNGLMKMKEYHFDDNTLSGLIVHNGCIYLKHLNYLDFRLWVLEN